MLGSRIAFLRERAGMSREELAQQICVTPSALGSYEQGRRSPSADILVSTARALGVSVDFLLSGQPASGEELAVATAYQLHLRAQALPEDDGKNTLVLRLLMELMDPPGMGQD